jgi:hypothetical protein
MNIHVFSRIRNRNSYSRATVSLHIRPHGHRYWPPILLRNERNLISVHTFRIYCPMCVCVCVWVCVFVIRYQKSERSGLKHLWVFAEIGVGKVVLFFGAWNTITSLIFRGSYIVVYSYNKSKQDALFLKFIWKSTLHVSDRSTVHHQ